MNDLDYFAKKLALWLGAGLFLASFFAHILFSVSRNFPAGQVIEIKKGSSLAEIAEGLKESGAIKSPYLFKAFIVLSSRQADIKAGHYFFEEPLTMFEISKRLALGVYGIEPVRAVVLEGWSNEQTGEYFEKLGLFEKEDWTRATKGQEGYIFPDTYFFMPDAGIGDAVKVMRENFDKKVIKGLGEEISKSGRELGEIVIMASLIEKEASSPEDARVISGILWKRFESDIGLQVDATVSYVVGKPSLELTDEDLAVDSPFNTYKYRGLPPASIGNPGLEAVKAAISPAKSLYWYYLHDSDGEPHYAITFEEHKANKQKYLK